MNSWLVFGIGGAAVSGVFVLAWFVARRVDNYSLVDPAWAFGIGFAALIWFLSGVVHLKQIVGIAMMIFLLLRVTGIPPTEAAALLRKGDAYRDYQRTTSAFIPWPPRR